MNVFLLVGVMGSLLVSVEMICNNDIMEGTRLVNAMVAV
jgi:hypothetical protein